MTDIFLSYKAEDRARVAPMVAAFEAAGLSVWWDVRIEGGAAWRETIQRNLDAAACVVVVWSAQSVGSAGHFVQDEAARGHRRGVYLPVALDAVEPPLGFGQDQVVSLVGWRGDPDDPRFADVLAAVRALIKGGPRPAPSARGARLAGRRLLVWGSAALAAIALAVVVALALVRAPASHAPPDSIAVAPFANLGGDPGQDYFADGLTEELIASLARLAPLKVAGRTSSFRFKGVKTDSAEMGAKLGVVWVLDGSVRRNGRLVRVSAELVEAKTGYARWSQSYDRDPSDVFAVQSGIAQSVAQALQVQLLGADIADLSLGATSSPAAYDAYLRGRRLFDRGGGEATYRQALAQLDDAIAADPAFAAAHAVRARTLVVIANQFTPAIGMRRAYDAALESARRAVRLAPDLAEAQAGLASALINARLDFEGAKAAYARAIAAGRGNADVLTAYGVFAAQQGDFRGGVDACARAVELDPLNPRAFKALGLALMAARRYPEAIVAMRRALALSPGVNGVHAAIGDALFLQGRLAEARAEYGREPAGWSRATGEAIVRQRVGDFAGAKAALKALLGDDPDASAYQEAQVYAQWGDPIRALAALDAAFKVGDAGLVLLRTDPMMDPLRADPRFAARLARLATPT